MLNNATALDVGDGQRREMQLLHHNETIEYVCLHDMLKDEDVMRGRAKQDRRTSLLTTEGQGKRDKASYQPVSS